MSIETNGTAHTIDQYRDAADLFKAVADPGRLCLLHMIAAAGPKGITVSDCMEAMQPLSQPTVSHHVKVLKAAGLINQLPRRAGQMSFRFYAAVPARVTQLKVLLSGIGRTR